MRKPANVPHTLATTATIGLFPATMNTSHSVVHVHVIANSILWYLVPPVDDYVPRSVTSFVWLLHATGLLRHH